MKYIHQGVANATDPARLAPTRALLSALFGGGAGLGAPGDREDELPGRVRDRRDRARVRERAVPARELPVHRRPGITTHADAREGREHSERSQLNWGDPLLVVDEKPEAPGHRGIGVHD